VGLLWLGFSEGGKTGNGKDLTPAEVKWTGTMNLVTENISVVFDGKSARCTADNNLTPGHFVMRVTNYSDQPLVCAVAFRDFVLGGYVPADEKWLVAPVTVPAIEPQKTGSINIRVEMPRDVPDGKYILQVEVSKNGQVGRCPVYFNVMRREGVST
jgi:hypothetical protein